MPEDIEVDTEPQPSRVESYFEILGRVNKNPYSQEAFDRVVGLARAEETEPISQTGPYDKLSLDELIILAGKVRQAKDLETQYRLLSEETSTGDLWYDAILGRSNLNPSEFLSRHLGGRYWSKALDVGCGPGTLTDLLGDKCGQVIGFDRLKFLIDVAREHKKLQKAKLITGNAAHLPFANRSFDLIVSNGMTGYLNEDDLRGYCQEVARVLEPDGSYFEVSLTGDPQAPLHRIESHFLSNAKGMLACLIEGLITSGKYGESQRPPTDEIMRDEFRKQGLQDVEFTDFAEGLTISRFGRRIGMDDLVEMSIY